MRIYVLWILVLLSGLSCKDQKAFLPKVLGASGDVLVVVPDWQWKGTIGGELTKLLSQTVEALPQQESMFNVVQIKESAFKNPYKQYRNIIIVKVADQYSKKKIYLMKNKWADTQIVLTITAPSDTAFISLLEEKGQKINSIINQVERLRLTELYQSIPDRHINEILLKRHRIKLSIPKSYILDMDSSDFTWLSCEQRNIIQGILVYHYNASDSNIYNSRELIEKRNQFLRKYVKGGMEGSYMSTEELITPLFNQFLLNNRTTYEIRGLWRMQDGLAMGGPFISITQFDKRHQRFITVEGFVYAPAHKKREYLRQVEAIAFSLDIQ